MSSQLRSSFLCGCALLSLLYLPDCCRILGAGSLASSRALLSSAALGVAEVARAPSVRATSARRVPVSPGLSAGQGPPRESAER